ncbi:ABC transporter substrate-binding protein [Falseniella ignava]|uniref:Solute-binding protein family 5 domain-containing protein n=1 Tax=Falseniella ignava CCUG 37419 TaxID=883112 RepID=K1M0A4_9LACT|nr:ABC transporter substrate-binding protein [Falseniella ignava]EKB55738.1 hypothetical protein HMPREF9707_00925 [Falseniella ignava CCUG 37419]
MKKTIAFMMVALLCLSQMVLSPAQVQSASEFDANRLRVAYSVDPDGLDPQRTVAASTFQVTSNIYDTLVKVTPAGELQPGLAESWEVSEDGLQITFKLVEGKQFHNGEPFNAQAVVNSFERLKEEDSPRAKDYQNIIEMEAVSEYEVRFTTEELDVDLPSKFAYAWTAIVETGVADSLRTQPVGTGSYRLVEWTPQERILLEAYEGALTQAKIRTVEMRNIPDPQARVLAMQSGEVDFMSISGEQRPLVETISGYQVIANPMNGIQLMPMNQENEYLKDPQVRRAIAMAVNKESLIEHIFADDGQKIGSHYPPILANYVDLSEYIPYDVEGAKQLMEEAGYGDGFKLKMYLPKDYQMYVDAGQVIAEELKQLKIQVEIEVVEWAYWLENVYQGRQYDLTVVGHTGRLDSYQWLARYHSESPENYFNYSNERVDEILETVSQIQDATERDVLYQELQTILAEEVPAVYIQSPAQLMAMREEIQGYETYPIDIMPYSDLSYR